jgi:hypothetical protein
MTSSPDAPLRYHLACLLASRARNKSRSDPCHRTLYAPSRGRLNLISSARAGLRWKLLDKLFLLLNGSLLPEATQYGGLYLLETAHIALYHSLILTLWPFCLLRQGWRIRSLRSTSYETSMSTCKNLRYHRNVSVCPQDYTVSQKCQCLSPRLYGVTKTSVSALKTIRCHRNVGVCPQDYTVSEKRWCLPARLYGVTEMLVSTRKTIQCQRNVGFYPQDYTVSQTTIWNCLRHEHVQNIHFHSFVSTFLCTFFFPSSYLSSTSFRSRGQGSIPGSNRVSEKLWVWNGVHSASWVQLRGYLIEK